MKSIAQKISVHRQIKVRVTIFLATIIFGFTERIFCQEYNINELNTFSNRVDATVRSATIYIDTLINQDTRNKIKLDTTSIYLLASNKTFSKFFDKKFTYLIFDKESAPEGNSISLKNTDKDTRLALNFSYKKESVIIGLGAATAVSDNIANLFSSSNLSPTTTISLNASWMPPSSRKLHFLKALADAVWNRKMNYLRSQRVFYTEYYKQKYNELYQDYSNAESFRNIDYIKMYEKETGLDKDLQFFKLRNDDSDILDSIQSSLDDKLYDYEINNKAWTFFTLWWFSGGVNLTKEKYETYDNNLAFENEIDKKSFDKWQIKASANYYYNKSSWRSKGRLIKSLYVSGTYQLTKRNTYADIDESEVVIQFRKNSNDSAYVFEKKKNVRDISKTPYEMSWKHEPNINATFILFPNYFSGINLGMTGSYEQGVRPIHKTKIGLLFNFVNTEDEKSKVNFELFITTDDIWNVDKEKNLKAEKTTLTKRTTFGINTSIPLNKLFFK